MRAQRSSSTHHRRRWPGLPRAAEHQCPHRPRRRDPARRSRAANRTTVAALAVANGIADADLIYVGQQLAIPGAPSAAPRPPRYTVRSGDTLGLDRLAARHVGGGARAAERAVEPEPDPDRPGAEGPAAAAAAPTRAGRPPAARPPTSCAAGETLSGIAVPLRHQGGADRGGQRAHRRSHLRRPAAPPRAGGRHGARPSPPPTSSAPATRSRASPGGSAPRSGPSRTPTASATPTSSSIGRTLKIPAGGTGGGGAIRCPVQGGATFMNDWGFPRSGGRFHEGNDLFAPAGTPGGGHRVGHRGADRRQASAATR